MALQYEIQRFPKRCVRGELACWDAKRQTVQGKEENEERGFSFLGEEEE